MNYQQHIQKALNYKTLRLHVLVNTMGYHLNKFHQKADYYLVKGFVETIFERLGINESRYRLERVESDNQSFHPGRSAYIKVQNEVVGVVGQVHPLMEKKYDVKDVYVVELNLSALLNIKTGKVNLDQFHNIHQFQEILL